MENGVHTAFGCEALVRPRSCLAEPTEDDSCVVDLGHLRAEVNVAHEEWVVIQDYWAILPGCITLLEGEVAYTSSLPSSSSTGPPAPNGDGKWLRVHLYRDGYREEGWIPRYLDGVCHLERADAYCFYVRLHRNSSGDKLGFTHRDSPDSKRLIITELSGGSNDVIDAWNRGCASVFPRDLIRVGDTIMSVNGVKDSAEQMTMMLQGNDLSFRLCMERPVVIATT